MPTCLATLPSTPAGCSLLSLSGYRLKQVQTRTQEELSEHQDKLFHGKGGQTLAQVFPRGCEVSVLGDTQKPSRHGPEQPASGSPA